MSRRSNSSTKWTLGDNKIIDDISGFDSLASKMLKLSGTQKGLLTSEMDWNPPQPQLKLRGIPDKQNVKNVRTEQIIFKEPPSPEDL